MAPLIPWLLSRQFHQFSKNAQKMDSLLRLGQQKVTLTKYCFLFNYMENNFLHAHTVQSLRWGSEETLADIEMYFCITNITNSFMTEKNFISGVRNQLVNELLTAPIYLISPTHPQIQPVHECKRRTDHNTGVLPYSLQTVCRFTQCWITVRTSQVKKLLGSRKILLGSCVRSSNVCLSN